MSNKLPKGYRVTVAPCKVVGQAPGQQWFAPRVWKDGQMIISELSHGLAYETREKARESGRRLVIEITIENNLL